MGDRRAHAATATPANQRPAVGAIPWCRRASRTTSATWPTQVVSRPGGRILRCQSRLVAVGGAPNPAFVGRTEELAVLAACIDRAGQGSPTVVLVAGEAGIGKTTLTREAASRSDAPLFVGRSVRVGSNGLPLAPIADLVRHVARSNQGAVLHDARFGVLESLAKRFEVGGVGCDGVIYTTFLELVGALSSDAVVIAFEDLHWADTATWDLFEFVARNLTEEHAILVGTYRDEEVGRDPLLRQRLAE